MAKLINFDLLKESVEEGMNRMVQTTGGETNEDLLLYNQLKPEHFNAIIGKYGLDETLDYIKKMESEAMKKNG